MDAIALKFVEGSDDLLEGVLMPFRGPFAGKDITNEFFSERTDFVLSWGKSGGWPLLYHHGVDADAGAEPVGYIATVEVKDGVGGWMQAQLDRGNEYFDAISDLVKAGKLFLSSGAMSHLVKKDAKTGEILRWPLVEGSLTPSPANPMATVDFATAKSHFKSAGLDIAELKATLEAETATEDETAPEIKSAGDEDVPAIKSLEGSYEDLIEDLRALLNPMSPFGPSCYSSIVATFADHVIVCRYEEDGDETYWKVAYSIGEDTEPVLGKATQVEQTYVPAKSAMAEHPLTLDAQYLTRHAQALAQRTEGLHERRVTEGRVLSTPNRHALTDSVKSLEWAMTAIQAILADTIRLEGEKAKADALTSPEALAREIEILRLYT